MRVLRAEGFRMSDVANGQVVAAMGKVGVFRLGGALVGTHALRRYEGEPGVRIGLDDAATTDDIASRASGACRSCWRTGSARPPRMSSPTSGSSPFRHSIGGADSVDVFRHAVGERGNQALARGFSH
jgi:hypothetical protein